MTSTDPRAALVVRPYRDEDEAEVIELLRTALGGGPAGERSTSFFRWKHHENPFGASFILVGEAEGRIVGIRPFLRWRFRAGAREVRAVQAVDTATHPEHQGLGIFSRLTVAALEALADEVDLVYNTPNDKSLPGYLKMGWRVVGRVPIAVRVRRPVRFATRLRSWRSPIEDAGPPPAVRAVTAAEALTDEAAVANLLATSGEPGRLATARTVDYLRWRYVVVPGLRYHAVRAETAGRLSGLAIFRVRPRGRLWETVIAEAIATTGDTATVRSLLRRCAAAAHVDHLTCSSPPGGARTGSGRSGFVRSPAGVTFTVNTLGHDVVPDATDLRSWALSLGDLEVF